jgi:uncharacterized protein (TIGR02246 family)
MNGRWAILLVAASAMLPLFHAGAAVGSREAVANTVRSYVSAWNRSDAHAISSLFSGDGDFVSPDGFYARGPSQIEAFYTAAFHRGYGGSKGDFVPRIVRQVSANVVAVDGVWSIDGAREANGTARAAEQGLAVAILVRQGGQWRVSLLREQSSAKTLEAANLD